MLCLCLDCPVCYNVVGQHVSTIRERLAELRAVFEYLETRPSSQTVDDTTFLDQLEAVNARFIELLNASSSYGSLNVQHFNTRVSFNVIFSRCSH
jgi:hypothetical protein